MTNLLLVKQGDVLAKLYTSNLNDIEETSNETCLISENSNNSLEGVSGVFNATRALIAKESDHSKETDQFSEEKTISFPESSDFIKYGEPTTSNFENEIEINPDDIEIDMGEVINIKVNDIFSSTSNSSTPLVNPVPKSTESLSIHPNRGNTIPEEGGWFNNVFIKPGHKGLIYGVCKTENS